MNILASNINTADKKALYLMTKRESKKIEGIPQGTIYAVDKYCIYEEEKERNKQGGGTEVYTQKVLTFVSGTEKFGTISATFIRSFEEILDIMGNDDFEIVITGGTSKGGRNYVNCELNCG